MNNYISHPSLHLKNTKEANFPISSILLWSTCLSWVLYLFLFTSQPITYPLSPSSTSLDRGTWHFGSELLWLEAFAAVSWLGVSPQKAQWWEERHSKISTPQLLESRTINEFSLIKSRPAWNCRETCLCLWQCKVSEESNLEICYKSYQICHTIWLKDFLFGHHTFPKEYQKEKVKLFSLNHVKCSIIRNWPE